LHSLGHCSPRVVTGARADAGDLSWSTDSTSSYLMYCVTSIGVLLVTTSFPLNRDTYTKWLELDLNTLKPGVDGVHGGVRPMRSTSFADCSAPTTVCGVKSLSPLVTFTNARVEIHGAKSGVLSFAMLSDDLPDAFMSAKYCFSPGNALVFACDG